MFLLAPIIALFSPVVPFLVIYCIIFLALLHLVFYLINPNSLDHLNCPGSLIYTLWVTCITCPHQFCIRCDTISNSSTFLFLGFTHWLISFFLSLYTCSGSSGSFSPCMRPFVPHIFLSCDILILFPVSSIQTLWITQLFGVYLAAVLFLFSSARTSYRTFDSCPSVRPSTLFSVFLLLDIFLLFFLLPSSSPQKYQSKLPGSPACKPPTLLIGSCSSFVSFSPPSAFHSSAFQMEER